MTEDEFICIRQAAAWCADTEAKPGSLEWQRQKLLEEIDQLRVALSDARDASSHMLELGWELHHEADHWVNGEADTNGDALLQTALVHWEKAIVIYNLHDIAERYRAEQKEKE